MSQPNVDESLAALAGAFSAEFPIRSALQYTPVRVGVSGKHLCKLLRSQDHAAFYPFLQVVLSWTDGEPFTTGDCGMFVSYLLSTFVCGVDVGIA